MAFFRRGKDKKKRRDNGSSDGTGESPTSEDEESSAKSSPQRVGVVSGVLSTGASPAEGEEASGETLFGDVVARRFGPNQSAADDAPPAVPERLPSDVDGEEPDAHGDETNRDATRGEHLRAVTPLFPDHPATPELEVDPMAHIGRATTITGNIVAEEDLEIQGTIEGSVRLANHQVTVGAEGHVKASVDANVVMVYGKITGDVIASELVEVEKGGIVGGDIKAPRIIMHDGAIIVGGVDMSASLPNGNGLNESASRDAIAGSDGIDAVEEEAPGRPHLMPVTPVESRADERADEDDLD